MNVRVIFMEDLLYLCNSKNIENPQRRQVTTDYGSMVFHILKIPLFSVIVCFFKLPLHLILLF